jgi:hypothetical protein
VFSEANGNPIRISDPENTPDPIKLTIQTSEGYFDLSNTTGVSILGGTPTQSTFIVLYGTIENINNALNGLVFKTQTTFAELKLTANDLSSTSGYGGPAESTQTVYARVLVDPNFQPGSSTARFQQISGVLNQTVLGNSQDIARNAQLQAKLPSLDRDQSMAPLFMTNAAQNNTARLTDAIVVDRGADRLTNRGNARSAEDTLDLRDAKAIEEVKFSADTQGVAENAQTGTSLRREENLLVGLGIVSAGYLAWAFNGGSLLAGAISTTPMWKPFDPLAVLDFNDRAATGEAGVGGEDNLQSLFG